MGKGTNYTECPGT